jgi:hypothetical protein
MLTKAQPVAACTAAEAYMLTLSLIVVGDPICNLDSFISHSLISMADLVPDPTQTTLAVCTADSRSVFG